LVLCLFQWSGSKYVTPLLDLQATRLILSVWFRRPIAGAETVLLSARDSPSLFFTRFYVNSFLPLAPSDPDQASFLYRFSLQRHAPVDGSRFPLVSLFLKSPKSDYEEELLFHRF